MPVFIVAVCGLAVMIGRAEEQLLPGKKLRLVWNDEFNGLTLDTNKWNVAPDAPRKGGWWSPSAVRLDGAGHLEIKTFKRRDQFVAGQINTKGKFQKAFGYFVARIKFQRQPGFWSAFWMMCDGVGHVGDEGRDGTEIDIVEKPWRDDRVQHTLHWDGYTKEHHRSKGVAAKAPGVMHGFHDCGLLWTPQEYVFYVDGKETWRTKAGGVSQVPEYLLLSSEVGPWGGDIHRADLPDSFFVDYVRVYDVAE
jgi:beta-glucanase (GH16 family)